MRPYSLILAMTAGLPLATMAVGDEPKPDPAPAPAAARPAAWTTAVKPKDLSKSVKKGLDWLVEHQHKDGGWGQGEESAQMQVRGVNAVLVDQSNVADTCIAALALIRAGSTPTEGPYKGAIAKAVGYVRGQVEASKAESLSVTSVNGTRVQGKLGPNIDTFLASMLLAEVKGRMPEDENQPVDLALDKVVDKIKRHQKDDGSFEGGGWAPVLAQAMSGKGINRARQAGANVSAMALAKADIGAKAQAQSFAFAAAPVAEAPAAEASSKPFSGRASSVGGSSRLMRESGSAKRGKTDGAAGVELYAQAASLGVLSDSDNTNKERLTALQKKNADLADGPVKDEVRKEIGAIEDTRKAQVQAQEDVVARLDDKQFLAGFGSNGGEEFLSYMTIGESLVVKGGKTWETWDASMTQNLDRVQNEDGSWSGHHCITGRTFCTSSALLVLMSDRTPVPIAARDEAKADR